MPVPDVSDVSVTPPAVAAIAAALDARAGLACRFDIDVLAECDSSNSRLMARAEAGAPSGTVIVAERQTAGRGRRGRHWTSAPGDSLTFSLLWRFPPDTALDGLSLAVGVALARALEDLGIEGIRLKWPNDVLLHGRKLAGILIELVSPPRAAQGPAAIIGVGLNLRLPADLPADVRAGAAALAEVTPALPDANQLLAALLAALHAQLEPFATAGFAALRGAWQQRHACADLSVCLSDDFNPPRVGICRGVDADGALLLETPDGLQRIVSGEVSLRPQA
ncbi:biotin--[acetyl-CoA-carboxylase] ligase [Sterolibacterium denitrificans]|nr:biotin--[acetyl-CoA-carboxylase] ligase [Sterolibacterium denitrificans]